MDNLHGHWIYLLDVDWHFEINGGIRNICACSCTSTAQLCSTIVLLLVRYLAHCFTVLFFVVLIFCFMFLVDCCTADSGIIPGAVQSVRSDNHAAHLSSGK